ncbi:MAG: flagellar motor switch protein FliN [Ignavibacteriales bacterium]
MGGRKGSPNTPGADELKSLGEGMARLLDGATEALSTLLGKDVSFTATGTSTITEAPAVERGSDNVVAEIAISGDVDGKCLLRCGAGAASRVVDLLMGGDGTKEGEIGAEQLDALSELVNQATGAATAAGGAVMGIQCTHAVQRVFVLSPDSAEAFNNSLDYPVLKFAWSMNVGDGMTVGVDQLVERRLSNALIERLAGAPEESAVPAEGGKGVAAVAGPVASIVPEEISKILESAGAAESAEAQPVAAGGKKGGKGVVVQAHEFPEIQDGGPMPEPRKIDMLLDVPLHLTVELGRTKRLVKEILQLGPGSVLELDKLAGEAVDVLVNGRLLAKAEVVVIDENFGVRITEIVSRSDRLKELKQ